MLLGRKVDEMTKGGGKQDPPSSMCPLLHTLRERQLPKREEGEGVKGASDAAFFLTAEGCVSPCF